MIYYVFPNPCIQGPLKASVDFECRLGVFMAFRVARLRLAGIGLSELNGPGGVQGLGLKGGRADLASPQAQQQKKGVGFRASSCRKELPF